MQLSCLGTARQKSNIQESQLAFQATRPGERIMSKIVSFGAALALLASTAHADPLPSWNDGASKARIVAFVEAVTDPDSPDFVPVAERIATFDNDGNLWAEQPVYFQLLFALDYLAERAKTDPSLLSSDILKSAAEGDLKAVMAGGKEGLLEVVSASHSGMSVDDFVVAARNWLNTEKHPTTGRPFVEHIYQPMLELLRYLRDEDFDTFIVSGGGVHFIRAISEDAYGIPPENVIGSVAESSYAIIDGDPTIMKEPGIAFIDDGEGKPIGIDRRIGRRPIFASGNSDGDYAMLQWTAAGDGPRLSMLLHHTDDEREWAYDRDSQIGHLEKGLTDGPGMDWLIVDMKSDWDTVFSQDK